MDSHSSSGHLQHKKKTMIISGDVKRQQKLLSENQPNEVVLPEKKEIMLFILGMAERINFSNVSQVVLGRFDSQVKTETQIDLSGFGAVERGVSRQHCQLSLQNSKLTVIDLGSSNGTYISGKRLVPHQTYVLKKGEELQLGRLPIQIIVKG